jgi:hypothetical protein
MPEMTPLIVFANSKADCENIKESYADVVVRVPLFRSKELLPCLPKETRVWMDPCFDGYPTARKDSDWFQAMKDVLPEHARLMNEAFVASPDKNVLLDACRTIVDAMLQHRPDWVSVPQLPQSEGVVHNKINRLLAQAFAKALQEKRFRGKSMLPAVFTHQEQSNKKTERNQRVACIKRCAQEANADGIWTVDASVADQSGAGPLATVRFPGLIALQEEIAEATNASIRVTGPYWGLNLVLWARGLATHPASGVGSGYQYYVSGGLIKGSVARLALAPLRRWARADHDLKSWLGKAVTKLGADPAAAVFSEMAKNFGALTRDRGKRQIAKFYRAWFDKLESVAPTGRALALFQDLSSAYAIGAMLPAVESEEGTARPPGIVAQQLMMRCLG